MVDDWKHFADAHAKLRHAFKLFEHRKEVVTVAQEIIVCYQRGQGHFGLQRDDCELHHHC
jgi:hypothetical protein